MKLKIIFKNLEKFKVTNNFNVNVLSKIDKSRKYYLYIYPFLGGLLAAISFFIILIAIFQISSYISDILILIAGGIIIFDLSKIKGLWKNKIKFL